MGFLYVICLRIFDGLSLFWRQFLYSALLDVGFGFPMSGGWPVIFALFCGCIGQFVFGFRLVDMFLHTLALAHINHFPGLEFDNEFFSFVQMVCRWARVLLVPVRRIQSVLDLTEQQALLLYFIALKDLRCGDSRCLVCYMAISFRVLCEN